jgi:hypothetical protein
MHNSPISKAFYNNIAEVLSGKTTKKVELPASLIEAAKNARKDLQESLLTEGYTSIERKKEILRKHLKEGAAKCGCNLTNQMVARFDEMVYEDEAPVVAEASKDKMPTQNSPLATPSEVAKKTAKPESKGGTGKNPAKIGEENVAEAQQILETTEALDAFVNELNEDEIRILKNILSNR